MIENLHPYESGVGKKLVMREFLPDSKSRPRAGIVLVHGLGDYVMRYSDVAEELTSLGIAVVAIDLPGHGQSEGKRGVVGRMSDAHTVIDEARGVLRDIVDPIDSKVGALAHSTGGMIVFDYLTRYPGNLAFAWVNACLVNPLHRRNSNSTRVAKLVSFVAPSHTVSTCVLPSMGRVGEPDEHPPPEEGRGHNRVSLRFGLELIRSQQRIAEFSTNLNRDFRLLMTHGSKDEVCPINYAREFYSSLPIKKKEFREFPEQLHHTLHDEGVMTIGKDWLRRVIDPSSI